MKKLILLALIFFLGATIGFASDLPEPVAKRIKHEFPRATIRFDGLIELSDKTQYLPVFPLNLKKIQGDAQVVETYPRKKKISQKPDLILFNNNFALLKVIKTPDNNPTIVYYDKMPLCVKLGILPQDLLVPENLVIPEGLEVLLGDLVIPIKEGRDEFAEFEDFDKYFNPKKAREIAAKKKAAKLKAKTKHKKSIFLGKAPELKGKVFYSINYYTNAIEVTNPETSHVEYQIPLKSRPADFIQTLNKRYLLVSTLGSKGVSVIDLLKNEVVKDVETGELPSSIVLDKTRNIAYIANLKSSSITVFDLHNMDVVETIKVKGNPARLSLSRDRKSILYLDSLTDNLYALEMGEDFNDNKFLFKTKNLSKAIKIGDKICAIYRNKNYLEVFDLEYNQSIEKIAVGEKPLDLKIIGSKAYVLNAASDSLSVVDLHIYENMKEVPLNTGGFPSRISVLDSRTRAVITTAAGNEYILFDLRKDEIIDRFPISTNINKLIISRKYKK